MSYLLAPRVIITRCPGGSRGVRRSAGAGERFWSKVRKSLDGCWEWTAYRDKRGYGRMGTTDPRGRQVLIYAHRVSYEMHLERPPADRDVLHKCDNPSCVRPDHLFLGTQAQNNADMIAKGRHRSVAGEANHNAKATCDVVREMRARHRAGESAASLGRQFGISNGNACNIVKGKAWKHVTETPS